MTKFEKLYPNVGPLKTIIEAYPTAKPYAHDILYGQNSGSCFICQSSTKWIEINFETYICSEECLKRINRQWIEASKQSDRRHIHGI